jgi:CBS-domain-containing membrane protein
LNQAHAYDLSPKALTRFTKANLVRIPLMAANDAVARGGQTVADVMVRSPKTLAADATVGAALRLFENQRVRMALLVEDDRRFRGVLTRDDLPHDAGLEEPAVRFARPANPISPGLSAAAAFDEIARDPGRRLVVLDSDGTTLLGLLCLNSSRTNFCGGAEPHLPGSDA